MSSYDKGQRGVASVLALWLVIGGCFGVWVLAQRASDQIREGWPPAYPLLFLPNGRYLAGASLGFEILLADTIYLWSIQYYGHRRTEEGRSYLRHIYHTVTDLDPKFIDAYLTGALVMAQDMKDPALAIELIDKGIENNPDNWLLPFEAGWYSSLNLEDYDQAERYFQMAMGIPGAPAFVERLRAHTIAQQGNLILALQQWEAILDEAEAAGDQQTAAYAEQHVYDLAVQIMIDAIEQAIAAYEASEGRKPESLAVLHNVGLLSIGFFNDQGDPLNPSDEPFLYDPVTGEVTDPSANRARTER